MLGIRDRSDYRCMADERLVEEAKYDPNAELAIVLAERLEQAKREVERAWVEAGRDF